MHQVEHHLVNLIHDLSFDKYAYNLLLIFVSFITTRIQGIRSQLVTLNNIFFSWLCKLYVYINNLIKIFLFFFFFILAINLVNVISVVSVECFGLEIEKCKDNGKRFNLFPW